MTPATPSRVASSTACLVFQTTARPAPLVALPLYTLAEKMRPTLTLKKRPAVSAPTDTTVEPARATAIEPQPELPLPAEKPPKAGKAAKPSAKELKEAQAAANRLIGQEDAARRAAYLLKMKPIVQAYLNNQPVMRDIVEVDGVECLRPLTIGVHKTFLAQLHSQPGAQGCSKTVLNDLIKVVMHVHVKKLQYMQGLVKFPHRFDLDGNPAEAIGDELKKDIQAQLNKRSQKRKAKKQEPDSATS